MMFRQEPGLAKQQPPEKKVVALTVEQQAYISENHGLLVSCVRSFVRGYSNVLPLQIVDELYGVASEGLLAALKKFDPNKGSRFSNFAYQYMIGYMRNFLNIEKMQGMGSVSAAQSISNIHQEWDAYRQRRPDATRAEFRRDMQHTDPTQFDIATAGTGRLDLVSISQPLVSGDTASRATLEDTIPAPPTNPVEQLDVQFIPTILAELTTPNHPLLNNQEKQVIRILLANISTDKFTNRALAKIMGLTPQRTQQIQQQIIRTLRADPYYSQVIADFLAD
jgi:RNA polymerase sigma factor (sigma-70 family)